MHDQVWCPIELGKFLHRESIGNAAGIPLAPEPLPREAADFGERIENADVAQNAGDVRAEIDAGADPPQARGLLIDLHTVSRALQQDGCGRPAQACPDDRNARLTRHAFSHHLSTAVSGVWPSGAGTPKVFSTRHTME